MTTTRDPALIVLVAGLGLASSLLLGGCSLLPNISELAKDKGSSSERSTTGDGEEDTGSDSDGSDASDDQSGDPDSSDPGSGDSLALPDGMPDDIPIIDGTIVTSEDLGTGWAVWVSVADATDGFHAAEDQLTDAGFTEDVSLGNATDGWYASFSGDDYGLQLTAKDDNGDDLGPVVSYTVYATE